LALDKGSTPGRVVVVDGGQWSGRGAYLCRQKACLDRAIQRKAFQRAFRGQVTVVQNELEAVIMFGPGMQPDECDGR